MPLGINRTDLNITGVNFLHGSPVTEPHEFGNLVNWTPTPTYFCNVVLLPLNIGNAVNWQVHPDELYGALHFGNYIGFVPTPPVPPFSGLELEDGTGFILLEDGGVILLEQQ